MIWLFVALAIGFVVLKAISKKQASGGPAESPRRKNPVTENEQAMFNRLIGALPHCIVLAQVSFGALLSSRSRASRNTFDRKIADFVVCDKAFQVLAIVELDDGSHRGNEARDATRDLLLTAAGYRVLRYSRIPNIDRVQADFTPATSGALP